jgi:hypothetical protein
MPDPGRRAYLAQIAAMIDDRTRRPGQHTAQTAPAWATRALGPVPADPPARHGWEDRAAAVAAYRETYGYDHPGDPIGPEPSRHVPDQRAAWHQASAALSPIGGPDVRALPDGWLWLLRDAYTAETAWAPRHPGKDVRLARLGAFNADLGAIRATAETQAARKIGDHDRAARHEHLAASYRAMRDRYQRREQILAPVMVARRKWEHATAGSRHLAIVADAELRRRYPSQKIEPLRSAETTLATGIEFEQLHQATDGKLTETAAWIRDLARQQQTVRARSAEHSRLVAFGEDPAWGDLGKVFPGRRASGRDEILQLPKPEIIPSERILHLVVEHDAGPDYEAVE